MRKNLLCPNLSHPDAQDWINSLGLRGFYRMYINNGYTIPPSPNSTETNIQVIDQANNPLGTLETQTVEEMIFINKELFNAIQQSEIVDNIVALMYDKIIGQQATDDSLNLNKIFKDVYEVFEATYRDAENKASTETDEKKVKYYSTIADRYRNVFKHFDDFYEAAINKLNSNGFKVKDKKSAINKIQDNQLEFTDNVDDSGDIESVEALYRKLDYSDEANFAMSSKDTASAHLKQALSLVPQYRPNAEGVLTTTKEKSYLALPIYEGIDLIWGELLFTLNSIPIGSKLDYLKNSNNPRHQKIVELIESNPNTKIRNEFESVFSKQYANFITVKISKPTTNIAVEGQDPTVTRTINVFNTNRNSANDILFDDWHENFINNTAIFSLDENNNRVINKTYLATLKTLGDSLNTFNEVKSVEEKGEILKEIFNNLKPFGIDVTPNTVSNWVNKAIKYNNFNTLVSIRRDVSAIYKSLVPKRDKEGKLITDFDSVNPYFDLSASDNSNLTQKNSSAYQIMVLAKAQNLINPVIFEASFITGDGKSKYAFSNNSYLTHQFNKVKTNAEFRYKLGATAFAADSIYLNRLNTDNNFLNRFEMFYMDSMGNDALAHIRNKQFKNMSDKEKEFARISLYMNNGTHAKDKQYSAGTGMFMSLINSDKTTHPIFKIPKLNTLANTISVTIKDRLVSAKELPTEGMKVGDAYLNTKNNFLYYWNGKGWKGLLKDSGYPDSAIGTTKTIFDISDDTYENIFRKLYMSERARVNSTIEKNKVIANDLGRQIKNYHNGANFGSQFIIFQGLNNYLFEADGTLKPESAVKNHVKAYLNNIFSDIALDQAQYWNQLGISNKDMNNQRYNKERLGHTEPFNTKEKNDFTFEYATNQFVFMFNQMQLFSGDIALHYKKSLEGSWVNFFKRMAKDIAPGLDYNFENPNYNIIVLKDFKKGSKHFEQYKAVLGEIIAKEYGENKLTVADAQEYTTLDEHIEVMRAGGRLDNTPEINEAIQRLKDGTNTSADINLILPPFQPMKPVYAEMVPNGEVAEVYYIKTSSFPLIPALTRGTELDKLRLFMENHKDSNGNPRPINRAVYESGIKIGIKGEPVDLFNSEGNITINSLPDSQVMTLPRSGFRIQMELPNHGTDGTNTEGTQMRKLIHVNMPNEGDSFINGKEYNNKHIKDVFNSLHYYNMIDGYRGLLKDLGFRQDGTLENPKKLIDLLKDEAISKDYSINDINSIQMVFEDGKFRFKLPLALNRSSEKFQAILNSLITNRVIKQDLPGFTAVQASSAGFKVTDVNSYMEKFGDNSITYINPNDTELNYARVSKESGKDIITISMENLDTDGGEPILPKLKAYLDKLEAENPNIDVHPYKFNVKMFLTREQELVVKNYLADRYSTIIEADIIVPNYFGDINIADYIKDGVLDTKRLPEELLTVIGIRIPTQGHNSMLKFKVKGFLSHNNGEMAIVPEDIVIQMGSDFDVDKLFIYRYEYTNDNGKFRKVPSMLNDILSGSIDIKSLSVTQRNNAILDMMSAKLTEGSLIHQLLMPNGFGALPDILREVQKTVKNNNKHYFTTRAQNNIHGVNNDGKVGVAVFSLFSTFNRKLQDVEFVKLEGMNLQFDHITVGDLTNIFTTTGEFKSDVIMYLQSAAVDNANEQILGLLNINDKTINIAGTMALLGLNEHYISYFLAQPELKSVVLEMAGNNDTSSLENEYKSVNDIIYEHISTITESNTVDEADIDFIISDSVPVNITLKELQDNLHTNNPVTDLKILKAFLALNDAASIVGKTMSVINMDSGGLGSTFASTLTKQNKFKNLSFNGSIAEGVGFEKLFKNRHDPSVATLNILDNSVKLYSQVYDFYGESVNKVLDTLTNSFGLKLNEDTVKTVFNSLKAYIYSDPNLFGEESLTALRNDLLYGKNNIADRFYKWANKTGNRNLVAKRIKARKATKEGMPNTIITVNTKATSNADDVNRVTSHFYAMLTSEDKVEKQLAEDMVKYFYLTGGSFSPTSIGKYINNDILDKYQFSSKIRNGMPEYLNGLDIDKGKFLIQFFQNNPRLINSGKLKNFSGEYKKGVLKSVSNIELPIISLYDDKKSVYRLFVKQSDKLFYEIPTTNEGKSISHYEFNEDVTFTNIKSDYVSNISGYSQAAIKAINDLNKDRPTLADIEDNSNYDVNYLTEIPVNGTNKAKEIFGYSPEASASTVLDNIISNQSIPSYLVNIARDLKTNFKDLGEVKLGYTGDTIGAMKGLNLELNTEKFGALDSDGVITFEEIFAKTFIHELLHGATAYYLKADNIMKLNGVQRRAVQRIKDLHRLHVQNYSDQAKLNKFIDIYNRLASSLKSKSKHNLDNDDINFFNANKDELYGYVSADEFVSEGLTNPVFRSKLQNTSLWSKLLETLRRLFGFGRTDLDVLYDSVSELMPSERPQGSMVKSKVTEAISDNTIIESRVEDVALELSEIFSKQITAFGNEFGINEGDELYQGTANTIMEGIIRDGEYPNLLVKSIDGKAYFFQRDMPTLLDIRKSVVDNLNSSTNFDIGEVAEKAVENKEMSLLDKFANKYLILLKQRQASLRGKIRANVDSGNLTHMQAELRRISNTIRVLNNKIKDEADNTAFSSVLELAEDKLKEIEVLFNNDLLNADNIADSIKYLTTIMEFNSTINMKDTSPFVSVLDDLSTKSNNLHKKLLRKSSLILNEELKRELNMDIDTYKLITSGSKDISSLSAQFMDFSNINNSYIQSLGYLIEKKQYDTSLELQDFSNEFKDLINAYESKYKVNNLEEFLQKDSKGNWTGNYLSKFSSEYYSKLNDLKFKAENTKLVLTTQNRDKWEADRRYIQENYPDQLARWDKRNNLNRYRKQFEKGLPNKSATDAGKYFIEIPHDKWIDPKWQEIQNLSNEDPKKKLFIFMKDTLKGINMRNSKQINFLGDFRKSNKELLLEGKVKGAIGNLHQDIKDTFENNELILTKDVDAITGDLQMVIPVRFFKGELAAEDKTRDLARIIEATKAQDIALQHKFESEPILMLYQNLINNSVEITDAKRSETDDDFVVINSKPKNMSELSLFMIQNYLYSYSRNKTEAENTYGKYVDFASHYLRIKGMGWNPFSAVGNLMQSITSNLALAASRQYFNGTDYNYALGKALSTFTNNSEAKKIEKLFDLLDLQPIVSELMYDKSRILNASNPDKLNSLDPMYLTQRVEMFNQSHTMIAVLHNMKTKDINGNEVSVYEAFDKNGKWNYEKYPDNPLANKDELFKARMKMRKIIIDVHGNYVRPMMGKKNFLLRAGLVFRTWLPQAINSRFGGKVTDDFLGMESEGRYRTTKNIIQSGKFKSAFKSLWGKDTNNLTLLEVANFRRTAAELIMIMTFTAIALLMKHLVDWDDMDDEAKMALTYQLNIIGRAQNDLLLFMNPATFKEMTKDPIPMMSIISDVWGVLNGAQRTITGDGFYKTGSRKDQSVLLKEVMDLIPFATQIDKNLSYSQNLFSDR